MKLTFTMPDSEDESVAGSLYRWLGRDKDVRASATLGLSSSGRAGTMGALDLIEVVVPQLTGLGQLLLSYVNWRGTHRKAPPLVVTANGVSIAITDGSPEMIAKIVELLSAADPAARPADMGTDVAT